MRKYLKEQRKKLGMTQEQVAEKIGISTNNYCDIENMNRQKDMNASILLRLSEALRIPASEMLEQERKLMNG